MFIKTCAAGISWIKFTLQPLQCLYPTWLFLITAFGFQFPPKIIQLGLSLFEMYQTNISGLSKTSLFALLLQVDFSEVTTRREAATAACTVLFYNVLFKWKSLHNMGVMWLFKKFLRLKFAPRTTHWDQTTASYCVSTLGGALRQWRCGFSSGSSPQKDDFCFCSTCFINNAEMEHALSGVSDNLLKQNVS